VDFLPKREGWIEGFGLRKAKDFDAGDEKGEEAEDGADCKSDRKPRDGA